MLDTSTARLEVPPFPFDPFGNEVIPSPFKGALSLDPVVEFWDQVAQGQRPGNRAMAAHVLEGVGRLPWMRQAIHDVELLGQNAGVLDDLLSAVFPPALSESRYAGALAPFGSQAIYLTKAFRRLLFHENGKGVVRRPVDLETFAVFKTVNAYLPILQQLYGVDVGFERSLILSLMCPVTRLERHFQIVLNYDFLRILTPSGLPPLSPADQERIFREAVNVELLKELLPPERFLFEGVMVVEAFEVTTQEAMSGLKQELIDQNSLLHRDRLSIVQEKMRSLLQLPDLAIRVGAFQGDQVFVVTPPCSGQVGDGGATTLAASPPHGACSLLDHSSCFQMSEFTCGTPSSRPGCKKVHLVEDMHQLPTYSPREEQLLSWGFECYLSKPLELDGETVGFLELASKAPRDLNWRRVLNVEKVAPLFAVAVRRTLEALSMRVQAVIKEQFTSIHAAVEWRFERAALDFIRRGGPTGGRIENIVFPDVYPLFGVSDIRSSSVLRNKAVREDLSRQLELARDVVAHASELRSLPFLDNLLFRLEKRALLIGTGLNSGDEMEILDFLRREIEPVFPRLEGFGVGVRERIDRYGKAVDRQLGLLYERRRDFDESLSRVSDAIAALLEEEQVKAQAIFPHYFEMHKTDGVDHGMYVGASLVEDPTAFDMVFVRNLRLWQLIVMCEVARKAEAIRPDLPMPLETAHLVLVQHAPLSIRFRSEEKQFTVDGAYNARYEIVKKRLDKAEIRETGERLTQPRKIAIAYSHEREAQEYQGYLEYLAARGQIEDDVEDFELSELQGVHGLRALRASVRM